MSFIVANRLCCCNKQNNKGEGASKASSELSKLSTWFNAWHCFELSKLSRGINTWYCRYHPRNVENITDHPQMGKHIRELFILCRNNYINYVEASISSFLFDRMDYFWLSFVIIWIAFLICLDYYILTWKRSTDVKNYRIFFFMCTFLKLNNSSSIRSILLSLISKYAENMRI